MSNGLKLSEVAEIIKNSFSKIIKSPDLCIIFGSSVYSKLDSKRDIDILMVTQKEIEKSTLNKLKRSYFNLHKTLGLQPSFDFPGEYITSVQLKNSINGKGYEIDDKSKIIIKPIKENYEWNSYNEYRLFLSALSGPTIFVYGDYPKCEHYKKRALESLIFLILLDKQPKEFNSRNIYDLIVCGGESYFGFKKNTKLKQYLIKRINDILLNLYLQGILVKKNSKFRIIDSTLFNKYLKRVKQFYFKNEKSDS